MTLHILSEDLGLQLKAKRWLGNRDCEQVADPILRMFYELERDLTAYLAKHATFVERFGP